MYGSKEVIILKKNKFALIICMIFAILGVGILIYGTFYAFLTTMFGKRMDSNKIINTFTSNEELFKEVIEELNEEKNIRIEKNIDKVSYLIQRFDNGYKKPIKIDDEDKNYDNYKLSIKLMEQFQLKVIHKNNNNVEFEFSSMFGLGQYVVYINDMKEYRKNNSIIKIGKIKKNWYYVEVE